VTRERGHPIQVRHVPVSALRVIAANGWTDERLSMADDDAAAAGAQMPALLASFTVNDGPSTAAGDAGLTRVGR
jgi:hypothetical protein